MLISTTGARNIENERHLDLRSIVLDPQGSRKGEQKQTDKHNVKAHVERDWTASRLRLKNAEVEGMERSK